MSQHSAKVLKNILHFSTSNAYRHLLGLLSAVFRPAALGPELYGLWSLVNIIPTYASYLHLGSRTAMRYAIPQLENQQCTQQLQDTKTSALSGALMVNGCAAVMLLLFAFCSSYQNEAKVGLATMAGVILLSCYFEHSIAELKGYQNFLLVSKTNYLRYSLNFAFTLLLIFQYGFYGALLALIASLTLSSLYLAKHTRLSLPTQFSLQRFVSLAKLGLPILALDFVTILLRSVDKLLITLLLGAEALGLYAISTMLLGPLMNIPGASREVVEQVLMAKKQHLSEQQQLESYFFKPLRHNAYLMPLLIAIAYLALPVFIDVLLDDFTLAIIPTQTMLIGSYFLALTYPCRGIIVANQWQVNAALTALIAVLFHLAFTTAAIQANLGLWGVALSACASFLLLFVILIVFILSRYRRTIKRCCLQIGELIIPFILMCSGLSLIKRFAGAWDLLSISDCFMAISLFMLLYLPFLSIAHRLGRIGTGKKRNTCLLTK